MVDSARQLLDELMGRNRNLNPNEKGKQVHWDDPEFCQYYLVQFCPHDLFVNTKADLGACPKLHDDHVKRLYDESSPSIRKRQCEDEFLRFCNNMISEVDRKIQKGRQRLLLMNKGELPVSKHQEQLNILSERIKKLVNEAEEAGHRGDVDQAQDLMNLCDNLKVEKEKLLQNGNDNNSHWPLELAQAQEKQMEVCDVCGAFLIVGDAQQRIEDHLTGKQHLGYSKLRKVIDEMYALRRKERSAEDRAWSGTSETSSKKVKSSADDRDRGHRSRHSEERHRRDDRDSDRYKRDKYRRDRDGEKSRYKGGESRRRSRSRSKN